MLDYGNGSLQIYILRTWYPYMQCSTLVGYVHCAHMDDKMAATDLNSQCIRLFSVMENNRMH